MRKKKREKQVDTTTNLLTRGLRLQSSFTDRMWRKQETCFYFISPFVCDMPSTIMDTINIHEPQRGGTRFSHQWWRKQTGNIWIWINKACLIVKIHIEHVSSLKGTQCEQLLSQSKLSEWTRNDTPPNNMNETPQEWETEGCYRCS